MNAFTPSVCIVGAGQAGMVLSYYLSKKNVAHVVLEKERPFSAWYKRWDNFTFNTNNWMNTLPGGPFFAQAQGEDDFASRQDGIQYFEDYVANVVKPSINYCQVNSISQVLDGTWTVEATAVEPSSGAYTSPGLKRAPPEVGSYQSWNVACVVLCTGCQSVPVRPSLVSELPSGVTQLHSSEYRNPEQITTPHVVVVGSGSSGTQICHDLARSGRFNHIDFSTSGNQVLPLAVAGFNINNILQRFGMLDVTRASFIGRMIYKRTMGKGDPSTPPSPQALRKQYPVVHVCKRVTKVVHIVDGVKGDDSSQYHHHHIHHSGGTSDGDDEDGEEHFQCYMLTSDKHKIEVTEGKTTVVWCTGLCADYSMVQTLKDRHETIQNEDRTIIHTRGVVDSCPGLYVLGDKFQWTPSSSLLYGVGQDAEYICQEICRRLVRIKLRPSAT